MLDCALSGPALSLLITFVALPLLLMARYSILFARQQRVVVVTNHRIFSVCYEPGWLAVLPKCASAAGMSLRVDVFRHSREVFYGRMNCRAMPFLYRILTCIPWARGEVLMQSRFGVLCMLRRYGDAEDIYDLVSTYLSRDVDEFLHVNDFKGVVLPMRYGVQGEPSIFDRNSFENVLTWRSSVDADPHPVKEVPFTRRDETPLFIWSFMEAGVLRSPYNLFNDVVVTTDRIRLVSQAAHKTFDCRTYLCWGVCWCACIKWLCGGKGMPSMQSFLNFSHLQAFSTESALWPPLFPLHCPCYVALCQMLTSCACCAFGQCPRLSDFAGLPTTAPPRIQLWLLWMQRNAKVLQPDLVLSVRPYELREFDHPAAEDVAAEERQRFLADDSGPGGGARGSGQETTHADMEVVETLRSLMNKALTRQKEGNQTQTDELKPNFEE